MGKARKRVEYDLQVLLGWGLEELKGCDRLGAASPSGQAGRPQVPTRKRAFEHPSDVRV